MLDFKDLETYKLLLRVCSHHDIDPSASPETKKFFTDLLSTYEGNSNSESITAWLNEQVSQRFIALEKRPEWIQSEEWPIVDGEPAIFVGQFDVSTSNNNAASKIFHDDTSFYIFVVKKRPPIVVMQQY